MSTDPVDKSSTPNLSFSFITSDSVVLASVCDNLVHKYVDSDAYNQ